MKGFLTLHVFDIISIYAVCTQFGVDKGELSLPNPNLYLAFVHPVLSLGTLLYSEQPPVHSLRLALT
jgi:hypothetical protein